MSHYIPDNQKHLTLEDRIYIENSLHQGWDVNLIVNHINSTPRESLEGKAPYDLTAESFGEATLKALHLIRIASDEVNLTPKLICFNR